MKKYSLLALFLSLTINTAFADTTYLLKPTGQYSVGFEDHHLMNPRICPDPNYNHKNAEDFSENNPHHCREMMYRIYYPISATSKMGKSYYSPFIKDQRNILKQIPGITKQEINELKNIKTFTLKKAPIIKGIFPVIIFMPGLTFPIQFYENTITDLVSHGYIVIGINSPFVNLLALPNGHVVQPTKTIDPKELEEKYLPIAKQDLFFVFQNIHIFHEANSVSRAMDLKHIGALGHSAGARMLADMSHIYPSWFNAGVTLDIGFDTTGESQKQFAIPFMHQVAANRFSDPNDPVNFELGNNHYLVGLTPNVDNHDYSKHMNFSDLSTLQQLSAYQKSIAFLKATGIDIMGNADSQEIITASNLYTLAFFNTYLKNDDNSALKKCTVLEANTYIKCGIII